MPAHELCNILSSYGAAVRATPLTARKGCLPGSQPGEKECKFLGTTVSVKCSTGIDAAKAKRVYMRSMDGQCRRHVLIDDNKAAAQIQGGAPAIVHIKPKGWGWSKTRQEIHNALAGCN